MAIETLQQTTLGTVRDTTVSGSSITSQFENLGLGIAASLGSIGLAKLASVSQIAPPRAPVLSPAASALAYQARPATPGWASVALVVGLIALPIGLIAFAYRRK